MAGSASGAASVTVTVNPAIRHAISPYIYGINFYNSVDGAPADLTLDRTGGNRWTAYNWVTNASNAGRDYQYQNDNYLGGDKEPGSAVSKIIALDQKNHLASIVTVQLQGLVAGDMSGPVSVSNPPDTARFRSVVFEKRSVSKEPFTAHPSAADRSVYMDEFLWTLDQRFKNQNIFGTHPSTEPVFVSLDNEPELWNTTHLEIQGKSAVAVDSYITRSIALATALKRQFPNLVILGPAHFGFMGIYNWLGQMNASPPGHDWFADRYLTALRAAAAAFGRPLVDVYDFHWYPEATDSSGARVTTLMGGSLTDDQVQAIVQSPRSLWDRSYKERSWITKDVLGQPLYILDRLQGKIDAENPGMKIAITEYDNGGAQHIAGTIAEADDLGVFGEYGVFAATLWPLAPKEPYTLAGFRAYRDFDGAHHHFGDISVAASSSSTADVSAYVSIDSSRSGRVVMVVINRSTRDQVTLITGQPLSGVAHLFRMTARTAANQGPIRPVAAGEQPVSGTSMTLTLPALSVTTADIY
jgi:hypothetical protein